MVHMYSNCNATDLQAADVMGISWETPNYQRGCETEASFGSCTLEDTSMVTPYHQEAGFTCTSCDVWFRGRCKRARKAKKNLAHRHCRADGD